MKLTMLGTGNAVVTACYNTCFTLEENGAFFLVDGGGGNTLLRRLEQAGIDWRTIRTIFVTHKHIDHIIGILWMIRLICQGMARGEYDGEAVIYGHGEVISLLRDMAGKLLQEKQTRFLGEKLHLVAVEDGERREILGKTVTFFDIGSTKDRQFGFSMELGEGKTLTENRSRVLGVNNVRLVNISEDMSHLVILNNALADGEIVNIHGDRVFGSNRTVRCNILESEVELPLGPFLLASMREVPVISVFVMKVGLRRYRVYLFRPDEGLEGLGVREKAEAMARAYAINISVMLLIYPDQWFNFYEFWKND